MHSLAENIHISTSNAHVKVCFSVHNIHFPVNFTRFGLPSPQMIDNRPQFKHEVL